MFKRAYNAYAIGWTSLFSDIEYLKFYLRRRWHYPTEKYNKFLRAKVTQVWQTFRLNISRYSQQQVLENRNKRGYDATVPHAELSAIRILTSLLNTHCVALVIIVEQKSTIGWRWSDSRLCARISISQVEIHWGELALLVRVNNAWIIMR